MNLLFNRAAMHALYTEYFMNVAPVEVVSHHEIYTSSDVLNHSRREQ